MIKKEQMKIFREYPVIAAVRTPENFKRALESKVRVIFMVGGDYFKVEDLIKEMKSRNMMVLLHMDLIEGIGKDIGGIHYAMEHGHIDGVISTKSHMIKLAAKEDLITVHRVFLMDNQGLESGMNLVKASRPDIIELTPGLIPRIVRKVNNTYEQPVITSGLISRVSDVETMTRAGAVNIVCSCQELWGI
ncbi:MAG: glycerol-3-phosphate responsive antiterminator [Eubacterium sp.]